MKTCTKCKVEKVKEDFSKDRQRADGRFPWCKACTREDSAARYARSPEKYRARVAATKAANPEKVQQRDKAYYAKNKDKHAAHGRAWLRNNPQRRQVIMRKYHQTHREYARLQASARRARIKRLHLGEVTEAGVAGRIAVFGGLCAYCGAPYEHLDHVKPLHLGGPHMLANLRPACGLCNRRKGAKHPFVWLKEQGETCS